MVQPVGRSAAPAQVAVDVFASNDDDAISLDLARARPSGDDKLRVVYASLAAALRVSSGKRRRHLKAMVINAAEMTEIEIDDGLKLKSALIPDELQPQGSFQSATNHQLAFTQVLT